MHVMHSAVGLVAVSAYSFTISEVGSHCCSLRGGRLIRDVDAGNPSVKLLIRFAAIAKQKFRMAVIFAALATV